MSGLCPNCRMHIPEGARFCTSCGTPVVAFFPGTGPHHAPANPIGPPPKQPPRAASTVKWVIGALALCAVVLVGFVAAAAWPRNPFKPPKSTTNWTELKDVQTAASAYVAVEGRMPHGVPDLVNGNYLDSEPRCTYGNFTGAPEDIVEISCPRWSGVSP